MPVMQVLSSIDFVPGILPVELADDEIHLWLFSLPSSVNASRVEQERLLRDLLGAYLQIGPGALRMQREAHGKPYLIDLPADAALQFNLSHSGRALLIGVSRLQPLGVDVEMSQRSRPWLEIAQRYFTAAEFTALARLPAAQIGASFLALWSCKEAVLKALGRGIAFGLDRLEFALDSHGAVTDLLRIDTSVDVPAAARWHMVRLNMQSGLLGALAWHGTEHRIRAFRAGSLIDAA